MVNFDQTSKHGRGAITSIWLECTQIPRGDMEAQAIRTKRDDRLAQRHEKFALRDLSLTADGLHP